MISKTDLYIVVQLFHRWKLVTLLVAFITIGIFWNYTWIQPLKLIVVFLHEVSHAIGALITGGKVESISISWDESGYTITNGGKFLIIASAGYIGCILWGSIMLFASLSSQYCQYYSITLGALIAFFMISFSSGIETTIYFLVIFWSLFFIITGVLFQNISRYSLFYMGGITSLYGLFDLFDFFRGAIDKTDAGKIAKYCVRDPFLAKIMAYLIALLISLISVWTLYRTIKGSIFNKKESKDSLPEESFINEIEPPQQTVVVDQKLIDELQRLVNK